MAFLAQVKAQLGIDTTEFQAGLTKAQAMVGRAGDQMGSTLERAFGAKAIFKGLLHGFGIGSVLAVADKIRDMFAESARQAEAMRQSAEATAKAYREMAVARMSTESQLKIALIKRAQIEREIEETEEKTETRTKTGLTAAYGIKATTEEIVTQKADPEKRAKLMKELFEVDKNIATLTDKLKLSVNPYMGMVTRSSASSVAISLMPVSSVPVVNHAVKNAVVVGFSDSKDIFVGGPPDTIETACLEDIFPTLPFQSINSVASAE